MNRILTSLVVLSAIVTMDAHSAPTVRRLIPTVTTSAARAASPMRTTKTTATPLRAATTSATSSRLASSAFLGSRGKIPTSVSTPDNGNNNDDIDTSQFVTNDDFNNTITRIDQDVSDVLDEMADLELNGVPGADGKSAYEIAQDAGFTGTESEWLASLQGAPGDKGDKGDPGLPGVGGGATCADSGNGTYMISVVGDAETCVPVVTTGDIFIK